MYLKLGEGLNPISSNKVSPAKPDAKAIEQELLMLNENENDNNNFYQSNEYSHESQNQSFDHFFDHTANNNNINNNNNYTNNQYEETQLYNDQYINDPLMYQNQNEPYTQNDYFMNQNPNNQYQYTQMISRSPSPVLNLRPVQNLAYSNNKNSGFGDEYNQPVQQSQPKYAGMASMNSSSSLMRHLNNKVLPHPQENFNVIRGPRAGNNNENWL